MAGGPRQTARARRAAAAAGLVLLVGCAGPADPSSTSRSTVLEAGSSTAVGWSTVDVVDGDTLVVAGPEGTWRVRLIGINAPEVGECLAAESAAALARLVADRPLRLVTDESDVDRFGRALRYVETPGGLDVGAELVRRGLAVSNRYPPDTARNDVYDRLQAEAWAAGRGLWAPDACGPAAAGVRVEISVHPDAAGDDNLNLNDEWVRFTNTGSAPLDLDGWSVADTSATHRYTFRGLTVPPGGSVTLRTGCGPDSPTVRHWCNVDSAVWNNGGDTVFLRDPAGNTVAVQQY